PHAEAAVSSAIVGADYDRMAVYGSRAHRVLRAAGIPEERIVEVGAPRFDPLVAVAAEPSMAPRRRVVYAAQSPAGALTEETMAPGYAPALAVAAASGSEPVVRPHPADVRGAMAGLMRANPAANGLAVRIDSQGSLEELLRGARMLVTAWS